MLGSQLAVDLLARNYKIIGLVGEHSSFELLDSVLKSSGFQLNQIQIVTGDLFQLEALDELVSQADVVFHCAAKVSFWRKDTDAMHETNVMGTRNLVNAILKQNPKAGLIHVSSIAALGRNEQTPNAEITVNQEWVESKYNTSYAESKQLSELEVWRGAEEGLNVSVVVPGVIIGAGIKSKSSAQILSLSQKGNRYYPAGDNGFVTLNDVSRLMIHQFENKLWGQKLLAVSINCSYYELLTKFNIAFGHKPPTRLLKGAFFNFIVWILSFLESVGIPTPAPSQALRSTSTKSKYKIEPIAGFAFSDLLAEIPTIAAQYKIRNGLN